MRTDPGTVYKAPASWCGYRATAHGAPPSRQRRARENL